MRLTVGHSWDNHFFTCKGPFFRRLTNTNFKSRGCEDHFSRNVLMFDPSMDHVNFRVTMGACRDFETDLSKIKELRKV